MKPTFVELSAKELAKLERIKDSARKAPPYHANDCKNVLMSWQNHNWISRPDKKNTYRWKLIRDAKSAREAYSQLYDFTDIYDIKQTLDKLKLVQRDLKSHDIPIIFVGWEAKNFIDSAFEIAVDYMVKRGMDRHINLPFIMYTDYRQFIATISTGELILHHNIERKPIVDEIFKHHFGKAYQRKPNKVIILKLSKKVKAR